MRVFMCVLMLNCGAPSGRPAGAPPGSGIPADASTSTGGPIELRLDLPAAEPLPDLPGEDTTSTGAEPPPDLPAPGSTGPDSTGGGSTGEGTTSSTGEPGTTSGTTGEASTSTGEASSTSTGEPPPAPDVCGDGTCGPDEAALPCYGGNGWCYADCAKAPQCITDCPCAGPWLPQQSQDQVCHLAPGTCSATKPGGYCDPNGDGAYLDANFTRGVLEWAAKCKP